jgi:hypothetical protein
MRRLLRSAKVPHARPARPHFSSGPCAKRPGWSPHNLHLESLGRSHRSKLGKARLKLALDRPDGDAAALAARIAAQPKDFDARFQLAALQAHGGDFGAAFEQLLEVVLRDKAEARENARRQLVEWFALCPDPALVADLAAVPGDMLGNGGFLDGLNAVAVFGG